MLREVIIFHDFTATICRSEGDANEILKKYGKNSMKRFRDEPFVISTNEIKNDLVLFVEMGRDYGLMVENGTCDFEEKYKDYVIDTSEEDWWYNN